MGNVNLMPEFGYLLNANKGTIEFISNVGYVALIAHTLFTEKNTLLWEETDLNSLLFNLFGVTEPNELDLADDEQYEILNLIKSNSITKHSILYSVDGCKFSTTKIYANRLEAAIAINKNHQFGLYYCRYTWDLPKFTSISPTLDTAIEAFNSKLSEQSSEVVMVKQANGQSTEMTAAEFCEFIESNIQKKLFEAITFEEHLQQRFSVNSIYEMETHVDVDDMTLKFYKNLFKKNVSDYQAPMYFYTGPDLKPKSVSYADLQKLGPDGNKFRLHIALLVANAQSQLLKISSAEVL